MFDNQLHLIDSYD